MQQLFVSIKLVQNSFFQYLEIALRPILEENPRPLAPLFLSLFAFIGNLDWLKKIERLYYSEDEIGQQANQEYNSCFGTSHLRELLCPIMTAIVFGNFQVAKYIAYNTKWTTTKIQKLKAGIVEFQKKWPRFIHTSVEPKIPEFFVSLHREVKVFRRVVQY